MKIAILGSGRMGGTLGTIWAKAGHAVTFSYSRDVARLERLAREAGPGSGAKAGTPAEAVSDADAVLLAVPWSKVEDVLVQAGTRTGAQAGGLAGKVVVNCCVPLDEADRDLVVGTTDSGAEWLARRVPEARWVSAFNTAPSEVLPAVFARKGDANPPQLLFCGDDGHAKSVARTLIADAGFAALDCGPVRSARFVEPFAMVTAELAYAQPGGPKLVYRFDRLG